MPTLYLILNGIRSTHNVGAMLRTADGAGVQRVYLCGCTPAPIDRFGRKRKDVAKTSLGAEDMVAWEQAGDVLALLQKLKVDGVRVVALEQNVQSVPYNTLTLNAPTALLVGEEVHGLSQKVLDVCDVISEIPMYGKKESLNVSVAAGIALYQLRENAS
jgi:tRNA G18 (ribose-2'-O)-methylase SpoU